MQLTRHTDYAFRLLIDLAARGGERTQIAQVAAAQDISHSHLMKVVNRLVHAGIVDAARGRGGGIRLARDPHDINLADIVRTTEPRCPMVDCGGCKLARRCSLPAVLDRAADAFITTLARFTLADILPPAQERASPPRTAGPAALRANL
ncbi:Rrf2 family transcriptional regulator [Sphingomonas paucimobilis]|nr:Rrf2 family transcriptional regulator [Sphingomonas paucimobilis]